MNAQILTPWIYQWATSNLNAGATLPPWWEHIIGRAIPGYVGYPYLYPYPYPFMEFNNLCTKQKPRRTYSWRINSQIAEKVSSIERYKKDRARIAGNHGAPRGAWYPSMSALSIVCSQDWRRKKKKNCFILIGHWWCRVPIYLFLLSWRCHHHHDIKTNFF